MSFVPVREPRFGRALADWFSGFGPGAGASAIPAGAAPVRRLRDACITGRGRTSRRRTPQTSNTSSTGTCIAVTMPLVIIAAPITRTSSRCISSLIPLAFAAAVWECTQ